MADEIRLSKNFIETELPMAPPLYVSVYLMTLATGGTAAEVAKKLNATETEVLYAWGYWKGKGYLKETAEEKPQPKPVLLTSERPEYSYTEIIGLSNELNKLQMQISAVQVIPSGMIMIWNGSVSEIPDGWILCNGENGTPDLTDKFVLGAGNNYSVGLTGGEAETILTVDQIPSHTHGYKRHAFDSNDSDQASSEKVYGVNNKTIDAYIGSTDSTGGDQSHNNMPPYYALCYIMKV